MRRAIHGCHVSLVAAVGGCASPRQTLRLYMVSAFSHSLLPTGLSVTVPQRGWHGTVPDRRTTCPSRFRSAATGASSLGMSSGYASSGDFVLPCRAVSRLHPLDVHACGPLVVRVSGPPVRGPRHSKTLARARCAFGKQCPAHVCYARAALARPSLTAIDLRCRPWFFGRLTVGVLRRLRAAAGPASSLLPDAWLTDQTLPRRGNPWSWPGTHRRLGRSLSEHAPDALRLRT